MLRKFFLLCQLVFFLTTGCQVDNWSSPSELKILKSIRQSIFKIRVVSQEPDFRRPWTYRNASKSTGTGFYIGSNRILTNAHVVANGRYITVQKDGDEKAYTAYVTHIAHDCDLAMLSVTESGYFDGLDALPFTEIPQLRSPVSTIGFPTGGEQISITKGIVSRIEYRRYVHPHNTKHLIVQVDSAINSGNSGGPVLQNQKVVGVAFQSYSGAENTGYIIPSTVVEHFLKDIEDGKYDGYPQLGIQLSQTATANTATSTFHEIPTGAGGVKIAFVGQWSPFYRLLFAGDIILSIDQKKIGTDSRISFKGERVSFFTIFDSKQIGDKVAFSILRDGKAISLKPTIKHGKNPPNNGYLYDKQAPYIVVGGIIFTQLNRSYLKSLGHNWYKEAHPLFKYLFYHGPYDTEYQQKQEFIVIAGKLPHAVNNDINMLKGGVVKQVQGQIVNSLKEFDLIISNSKEKYLMIELIGIGEPIVFLRENLKDSAPKIKSIYGLSKLKWLGPKEDGAVKMGTN
ncbi:MAG: trypsin-like peptidase domain-containing protein [Oligoflexales bacterium]